VLNTVNEQQATTVVESFLAPKTKHPSRCRQPRHWHAEPMQHRRQASDAAPRNVIYHISPTIYTPQQPEQQPDPKRAVPDTVDTARMSCIRSMN